MNTKSRTEIQTEIAKIADKYTCDAESINLLAVSKTRSVEELKLLINQGQKCFGENYLQEAIEKIESLSEYDLEWHYIGKIQSNKTRLIASYFDWVHTVDRFKIAQRLNDQRPAHLAPLKVCLQVNTSGEASKGGVSFDQLPILADELGELERIELRGLMTLPALNDDLEEQRLPFRALKEAFDSLRQRGLDLDTLSMGTTNDFEAAIAEGATIIRIGTALFGERKKGDIIHE